MELLFNSQNATNAVNSDLVFWGDLAFAGNYNGFQTFDISRPASPTLVANVACLGPRRRVGWDRDGNGESRRAVHLLDRTLADDKCGSPAVAPDDPTGWEGIRTFDVSDPAAPRHLESVYQDCGSHTHALVPDPSTTGCCCTSPPTRCVRANLRAGAGPAAGRDPLHGVSQVIEVSRDPNDPLGGVTANEIAEPKLTYPGDLDNRFVWSEHGLPGPRPSNPRRVPATTSACTLASCWPRPPAWSRRRCGGSTPRRCCPTPSSRCGFWRQHRPRRAGRRRHRRRLLAHRPVHLGREVRPGRRRVLRDGCPPVTPAINADTGRRHVVGTADGKRLSFFMIPGPEPGAYCSMHQGNFIPTPAATCR